MTTDRLLPPVSLGRGPGPRSAPIPVAPGLVGAGRAAVAAPATPARQSPLRGGRIRELVRKEVARPTGIASAARLAKPRGDALLSTATRAGALIGVSAAVYAVSLAAVAGLQAQSQEQAAAAAQPALDSLARTRAANDEMAAAIKDADARLQVLAHEYATTSEDMAAYQAEFQQLSSLVAKIQGSAAAMNTNFKLPTVTMRGAISSGGGGTTVVTTTTASGKP